MSHALYLQRGLLKSVGACQTFFQVHVAMAMHWRRGGRKEKNPSQESGEDKTQKGGGTLSLEMLHT